MGCHTHHDREHEGHRAGVADEGSDEGRDQHDEQEEPGLAGSSQLDDLTSDHLGQSRLEDSSTHDEQADHHDDSRIGESRKSLGRRQHLTQKQGQQGTQGHKVRPHLSTHEQNRRNKEYYKCSYHI